MVWETLWALVLGFGLSGAVQTFVSKDAMQRSLGDHRPARSRAASVFGMASSSCSYAAAAMATSLVRKGADFITAMVFMFASTNLVIELGVVLIVLLGWQFAAAQLVGGVVMILLLAVFGGIALQRALCRRARARARHRRRRRRRRSLRPSRCSARPLGRGSRVATRGPTPRRTRSPISACSGRSS